MTNKKRVILDTNILMSTKRISSLIEEFKDCDLLVTLGTLGELDRLKTAEGQRGFEARNGLRMLRENEDLFTIIDTENPERPSYDKSTVDGDIIFLAQKENRLLSEIEVITNDLSMGTVAKANRVNVRTFYEDADKYREGYTVVDVSDELEDDTNAMLFALANQYISSLGLLENEYLVLEKHGEPYFFVVEEGRATKIFDNNPVRYNKHIKICSSEFGTLNPKEKDYAQFCAFDMLGKHDISLLTGPAGSGKTYLMLAKQFEMLEKEEICKITIFVNPEKARGAKTLGFYKGDRNLKLMQESIGGILASKIGEREKAIEYIESGIIEIIPISDIRGYEVTENSSLYITEAQNLNKDLMQLALQRAGEGTKVFIEGDPTTQLDSWAYEGDNNGMLKLIEVFAGTEVFGNIHLSNIYRSRVADLAERMTK